MSLYLPTALPPSLGSWSTPFPQIPLIPVLPSGSTQHLPLLVCIFFLIQIHTPAPRLTIRTMSRMQSQSHLLWREPGVKGWCQICFSQACWVGNGEQVGPPWLRACVLSVHPWCSSEKFLPFQYLYTLTTITIMFHHQTFCPISEQDPQRLPLVVCDIVHPLHLPLSSDSQKKNTF